MIIECESFSRKALQVEIFWSILVCPSFPRLSCIWYQVTLIFHVPMTCISCKIIGVHNYLVSHKLLKHTRVFISAFLFQSCTFPESHWSSPCLSPAAIRSSTTCRLKHDCNFSARKEEHFTLAKGNSFKLRPWETLVLQLIRRPNCATLEIGVGRAQ